MPKEEVLKRKEHLPGKESYERKSSCALDIE